MNVGSIYGDESFALFLSVALTGYRKQDKSHRRKDQLSCYIITFCVPLY